MLKETFISESMESIEKIFAELESVQEKRINFVTRMNEPRPPFWRMKVPRILLSWTVLAVLCAVVSISLLGVILYRQSGALSLVQILPDTLL